MKNRIKRLLVSLLTVVMVLTAIPVQSIYAASKNVVLENHSGYTYKFDSSFPAPFGYTLDEKPWWTFQISGNPVYCIEYGHEVNTGDSFERKTSVNYLNSKQKIITKGFDFRI